MFVEIIGALLRQNHSFCHFFRAFLTLYPNLSAENKCDFASKDTKNVETSGVKDSAILSRGDVKDNSLEELDPLNQNELEQFDHRILSKHPDQSMGTKFI